LNLAAVGGGKIGHRDTEAQRIRDGGTPRDDGNKTGLVINFNKELLKRGITRLVLLMNLCVSVPLWPIPLVVAKPTQWGFGS
jgi:hypothetical protein